LPATIGTNSTRVRPYKVRAGRATTRDRIGSSSSSATYKFAGTQYTESEGHPFRNSKQKGLSDIGGEFFTQKRYREFGRTKNHHVSSNFPRRISLTGTFPLLAINPSLVPYASNAYSSDPELDALGATAISRVAPNNPVAGLTAALTELKRDGLPHLPAITSNWEDRTRIAKNLGNEYLNVQFGYLPLAHDASDFGSTVSHAHSVIEQYKRGIGKPIRRTFHFDDIHTSSETIINTAAYPHVWGLSSDWYNISAGASTGVLIQRTETTRKQWFSGCFTYYFPDEILGSKKLADLAILGKQLGLEPSPELLWQVAPWSWAVDWFSNTGDVITNWTRFHEDGLIMRYGYMMEHTICKITYTLLGARATGGVNLPVSDVTSVVETKVRRKANPYGFGVSWNGLSTFQASILAAIGISR